MANVKVFAHKQTDKRRYQKLSANDLPMPGHKKDLLPSNKQPSESYSHYLALMAWAISTPR